MAVALYVRASIAKQAGKETYPFQPTQSMADLAQWIKNQHFTTKLWGCLFI